MYIFIYDIYIYIYICIYILYIILIPFTLRLVKEPRARALVQPSPVSGCDAMGRENAHLARRQPSWHSDDWKKTTWRKGAGRVRDWHLKNAIKKATAIKRESIVICSYLFNDIYQTLCWGQHWQTIKVSMICLVQRCMCLGYHLGSPPPQKKSKQVVWV